MPILDLDEQDMRVLNDALIQMPYGRVATLIQKLNKQITEQTKSQPDDDLRASTT